MQWGNEIPEHIFPKIKIHKWGWAPCEVGVGWKIPEKDYEGNDKTVATMGFHSVPYLGIKIDSNNIYERVFQETLKLIKNMCRTVRGKKASTDLKACSAFTRSSIVAQLAHGRWRSSENGTSPSNPYIERSTTACQTTLRS